MFFTRDGYTASEANGTVEICFTHVGSFERAVTVELVTAEISAVDGADYDGISLSVTFDTEDMFCTDVVILGDSRLEEDEFIEATLTSSDVAVNFTLSRAEIRIHDASRKSSWG